jgi:hypothetical protein
LERDATITAGDFAEGQFFDGELGLYSAALRMIKFASEAPPSSSRTVEILTQATGTVEDFTVRTPADQILVDQTEGNVVLTTMHVTALTQPAGLALNPVESSQAAAFSAPLREFADIADDGPIDAAVTPGSPAVSKSLSVPPGQPTNGEFPAPAIAEIAVEANASAAHSADQAAAVETSFAATDPAQAAWWSWSERLGSDPFDDGDSVGPPGGNSVTLAAALAGAAQARPASDFETADGAAPASAEKTDWSDELDSLFAELAADDLARSLRADS